MSTNDYLKMQQSMCTELVYTILETITKHTIGKPKPNAKSYHEYDFEAKHVYTLNMLKVKDPSKFEYKQPKAKVVDTAPIMSSIGKGFRRAFSFKEKRVEDVNVDKLTGKQKTQNTYSNDSDDTK